MSLLDIFQFSAAHYLGALVVHLSKKPTKLPVLVLHTCSRAKKQNKNSDASPALPVLQQEMYMHTVKGWTAF